MLILRCARSESMPLPVVAETVDHEQHAVGACHLDFRAADSFFLDEITAASKTRSVQHVERHSIDVDSLAHDVACRTGNRRNDGGFVPGESVEQARLAGVGAASDHDCHAFAKEAALSRALLDPFEMLPH
jgi:hypothetical protein